MLNHSSMISCCHFNSMHLGNVISHPAATYLEINSSSQRKLLLSDLADGAFHAARAISPVTVVRHSSGVFVWSEKFLPGVWLIHGGIIGKDLVLTSCFRFRFPKNGIPCQLVVITVIVSFALSL